MIQICVARRQSVNSLYLSGSFPVRQQLNIKGLVGLFSSGDWLMLQNVLRNDLKSWSLYIGHNAKNYNHENAFSCHRMISNKQLTNIVTTK